MDFMGREDACAVLDDGSVGCWGRNGNPLFGDSSRQPGVGSKVTSVVGGSENFCGLLDGGKVSCWGRFRKGNNVEPPSDLESAKQVVLGNWHQCIVTISGKVRCWGNSGSGALDVPADLQIGSDSKVTVAFLAAGHQKTCASLSDGTVRCWGEWYVEKGEPLVQYASQNLGKIQYMTMGRHHACVVLAADSKIHCWAPKSYEWVQVPADIADAPAKYVAAGGYHICALLQNGKVRCWGKDNDARPDASGRVTNDEAEDLGEVRFISSGELHACVVKTDGTAHCWGFNQWIRNNVNHQPPEDFGKIRIDQCW